MIAIKHIIFDMHGPLVPVTRRLKTRTLMVCGSLILKHKKLTPKLIKEIFLACIGHYESDTEFMRSIGLLHEYMKGITNLLTVELYGKPNKELIGLLMKLKTCGIKLYIASNAPHAYLSWQLQKLQIPENLFEEIVTADEAALRPSNEQFKMIVKNNDKNLYLFIADRQTMDIEVAQAFGIKARLAKDPRVTKKILADVLRTYESGG